jgi:hypothetical protein
MSIVEPFVLLLAAFADLLPAGRGDWCSSHG